MPTTVDGATINGCASSRISRPLRESEMAGREGNVKRALGAMVGKVACWIRTASGLSSAGIPARLQLASPIPIKTAATTTIDIQPPPSACRSHQEGRRAASGPTLVLTPPRSQPPARRAAEDFLDWLITQDLAREWAVDDLWYLAEADFAEAHEIELPPRRVFLGALKKLPGVVVVYDRRVRDRAGQVVRKTTFYSFTEPELCTGEAAEEPRLAA